MPDLTPAAMDWLSSHHGVITTSALRACGVGRSTTDRLVRAGVLRARHKSVFSLGSAKQTLEQRCVVLCAAHPTGYVTGATAGKLAGLRRMPTMSGLVFAVPHGLRFEPEPGVVFRQTTALLKHHVDRRADGISILTPARLAFDLAADLAALDHLSVLHQLVDQGRTTLDELVAAGERLCHPRRRGSKRFRESLQRMGSGPASQSHPEVLLAELLHQRGVPVERQSMVVRGPGGRSARIDLAVPDVRWGIELDIHPEHRTMDGHAGDAKRYRDLHLVEWQIEPVTELDMHDPLTIADELSKLYHHRVATQPRVS